MRCLGLTLTAIFWAPMVRTSAIDICWCLSVIACLVIHDHRGEDEAVGLTSHSFLCYTNDACLDHRCLLELICDRASDHSWPLGR
jgi:hypothetical protein